MKKLILIAFLIAFVSCENNTPTINPNDLLIGNWSNATYDNEISTYTRVNTLPKEQYGISFKEENEFLEHTSGWCGTPPLSFFDIDGTWVSKEKELIEISTNTYLGTFQWRIISLDEKELRVKRELSEQEKEHRILMELFNEIWEIATSVSCTDESDWLFTSYGAKACGGPQGYIAYSNKIDTVKFLSKIETYTKSEQEFNKKWSVVSTCDIAPAPVSIKCINGFAVLKY